MTPDRAWRWCAAAGLIAFIVSRSFGWIPGLVSCGAPNGLGPIIAFEFVRSPAEVAALFGAEPCRSTLVGAQKIGLLVDALGFIPAYTTFLVLATMASARITDRWPVFSMIIVAMLGISAAADEVEGVILHRILTDLPGTPSLIDALWWPVHIKFVLLMTATLGIAIQLLAGRSRGGIVATLPVGLGALIALAGLPNMPTPVMMAGFTIAWVALLLCAGAAVLRPLLFSARGAPPPAPAPPSA